ncbi:hypothetical protein BV741P2_00030 [Phocaeicola phage BV741P2]|nr:hypothetical protein BV741P2_00030 [Phocaeicola phage BV741P2]
MNRIQQIPPFTVFYLFIYSIISLIYKMMEHLEQYKET